MATSERKRTLQTRRQLFDAAVALFEKKGFAGTSADDIAAAAKVSRATFFNHFGSKAAVLRFYGQHIEEQISAMLGVRAPEVAPLDELRRVLLVMAGEAEVHRTSLKIILVHSLKDGSYFSQPTPARAKILLHLAALIAEAQQAGQARTDLAARSVAVQLMGLYNHAVVAILFFDQPAKAAVDRLWEFAIGGLTSGGAAAAGAPRPEQHT